MELVRQTWKTAGEGLRASSVALFPVGSVENHGPHLPLGTDLMTASHIATAASKQGPFVLLPALPIGQSSDHRQFPGTLWVRSATLQQYVVETIRALSRHGLSRVVLVNGHGGNAAALDGACRELRESSIYAFIFQWWSAIPEEIEQICVGSPDHAGDMETSAMLHIDRPSVRSEWIPQAEDDGADAWGRTIHGVSVGFDTIDFTRSGVTGRPSAATSEKGRALMEAAVAKLVAFCSWFAEQTEDGLSIRPEAS